MHKNKGFTLVELLVVIAIIGLLATIAFISLNSARGKARDAKRVSDVRSLQSALEIYYNDQTTPEYPETLGLLDPDYVAAVPTPPEPNDGAICLNTDTTDDNAQLTSDYAYAGYVDTSTDGVPTGTAATLTTDYVAGADCDGSGGTDDTCGTYVLTTCLGGATGGLAAGPVYAVPTGISSTAP